MRKPSVILCVLLFAGGLVWWVGFRTPAGIVARTPTQDTTATRYFAELQGVPPNAPMADTVSPDGRYIVSDSAIADTHYSTIRVLDTRTGTIMRAVSIGEADPGSGRSYEAMWSADSKALLIRGSGSLWRTDVHPLCIVYVPANDNLLAAPSCR